MVVLNSAVTISKARGMLCLHVRTLLVPNEIIPTFVINFMVNEWWNTGKKTFVTRFWNKDVKEKEKKNLKAIAKVFESKSPGLKANPFQNS